MNTLAEEKFASFIAGRMDEREEKLIMNKRLEIKALPEFVSLIKESKYKSCKISNNTCLVENEKFYQYQKSDRKRTYKQMEEQSKDKIREANNLLYAKKSLETEFQELYEELEYYKNLDNSQIVFKKKLDVLKDQGIVEDIYNIV